MDQLFSFDTRCYKGEPWWDVLECKYFKKMGLNLFIYIFLSKKINIILFHNINRLINNFKILKIIF